MWIKTISNECTVDYTNMDSCLWISFTEAEELPNRILLCVTDGLGAVFFECDDNVGETHDVFKTLIKAMDELLNGRPLMDVKEMLAHILKATRFRYIQHKTQ